MGRLTVRSQNGTDIHQNVPHTLRATPWNGVSGALPTFLGA
ncbi:hypothetical protein [Sinomonas sp. R1AF57]|jgi:hypothetical protein|nr:hypothetical protein [Sinomonas sp. R1AF57]